jgi:hypothetical protein
LATNKYRVIEKHDIGKFKGYNIDLFKPKNNFSRMNSPSSLHPMSNRNQPPSSLSKFKIQGSEPTKKHHFESIKKPSMVKKPPLS